MNRLAAFVVAASALALASWLGAQVVGRKIVVTVHNASGEPITALRVDISGKGSECARLSPNETWRASFEVEGESSVGLSWTSAQAGSVEKSLDVYLMSGDAGNIQVRVEPGAVLRWQGYLRSRWALKGYSVGGVVW
jgi:hypothetical protein